MISLTEIDQLAEPHALAVFGAFHADGNDGLPVAGGTLILLGPKEPGFWNHITEQPEWQDGMADPLDRWSARAIGGIASTIGGEAFFPFGGPPYHPFYQWALRSGRAWTSPVTLLVHDTAGLMVSYRGAILIPEPIDLKRHSRASPCLTCRERPCSTACPAGALTISGYDLEGCHGYLDMNEGNSCLSSGCAVRRACPVSQGYGRLAVQSAYHMGLFHK